jgi:hypothetical protein
VDIRDEFKIFEYHPASRKEDPVKRTLLHIEQQIRGLSGVSHLETRLDNWEQRGMQWIPEHE